jgi:DNA-binding NarL/FixJ family response regulator
MYRPRVLIADDHTFVAEYCKNLLENEFDVVGTVGDGLELIRTATALRPDVIVLDLNMPLMNGLDAARQVKQILPETKLIFLTVTADVDIAAEAFERGASGYLLKTCASPDLVMAVRDVLRGRLYLSPMLNRDYVDSLRSEHKKLIETKQQLTNRQREVLQLLAEGRGSKEVSYILNMTARTVAFHRWRIRKALGIKSNAELVRYAIRNHMTSAGSF